MVYQNGRTEDPDPNIQPNSVTTKESADSEATDETPPPQPSTDQNYMAVDEWSIKIPAETGSGGLTYSIVSGVLNVRSDELDRVSGSTCKTNSVIVVRGKASDLVPDETGGGSQSFEALYAEKMTQPLNTTSRGIAVKQGEYYYLPPGYAGASCVTIGYSEPGGREQSEAESAALLSIVRSINKLVVK